MGVYPERSSIYRCGFSLINQPFRGTPMTMETRKWAYFWRVKYPVFGTLWVISIYFDAKKPPNFLLPSGLPPACTWPQPCRPHGRRPHSPTASCHPGDCCRGRRRPPTQATQATQLCFDDAGLGHSCGSSEWGASINGWYPMYVYIYIIIIIMMIIITIITIIIIVVF